MDQQKEARRRQRAIAARKVYRQTTIAGKYETTLCHIRRRAKEKGLPCDITAGYLASIHPTHCPVLGVPIQHNTGKGVAALTSPSVDRIIPERGYIKGNVIIVSKLANQIRSCGSPEQILAVGMFYEKLLKETNVDPNPEIRDNESN